MSSRVLSVGTDSVITIGPNAALIVGGGDQLNAGTGLQSIGGLDISGHLERLGDPSSEADFNVGVTKILRVTNGEQLDQRGFLLSTGPNTVIEASKGGLIAGDQPLQGSSLTISSSTLNVPRVTVNGPITLLDTTSLPSLAAPAARRWITARAWASSI